MGWGGVGGGRAGRPAGRASRKRILTSLNTTPLTSREAINSDDLHFHLARRVLAPVFELRPFFAVPVVVTGLFQPQVTLNRVIRCDL